MYRVAAAAFIATLLATTPVFAEQERSSANERVTKSVASLAPHLFDDSQWMSAAARPSEPSRGPILTTLYVTLAAANALDAYTTMHSLSRGGREANPLMQGIAGNNTALWAVKTGASAITILAAERMWRKNRRSAAITALIVSNAVMLAVSAHNARVMRNAGNPHQPHD